ncbi:hypothetical protein JZ751_022981 [Albula glossodonta]|uniref:Homeobox domain-containing protein n=1 Tax=Albula glossodonta TaxID=121402 RepID=A0A8T2PHR5_9TELE|nr:hypothetical protein JZ751_022981 [Albula glossodonta]
MQEERLTMHCTAELRCSFPGQLTAVRRRYKSFMIDEILSKETCDYFEKLSTCPVGSSFPGVKPLLSYSESSSLLVYPLLSIVTHQDTSLSHLTQPLSTACPPSLSPPHSCASHSFSETSVSVSSESDTELGSIHRKKSRRNRTIFSEHQLLTLEKKFQRQKYLSTPDRSDLAQSLGLTQLQVKTWYQNRRMKWKKMVLKRGQKAPTKPKGRPKKNSIPTTEEIEEEERLAKLAQQEGYLDHAFEHEEMPQDQDSKSHNPQLPEGSSQEQTPREQTDMLMAS